MDRQAVVYESIQDDKASSTKVAYGNIGPDLSFSRDLVEIKKELGRGAFGRVLLGTALGIEETGQRTKVAVKTLRGTLTPSYLLDFIMGPKPMMLFFVF